MNASLNPSEWVENYSDALLAFALARVSDRDAAKDLVQETFVAGLQSKDRFQGKSTEKTWLTAILKHKILDYYRTNPREVAESKLKEEGNESDQALLDQFFLNNGGWKLKPDRWDTDAEKILLEKEKGNQIQNCIENLAPKYRRIFVLREVDELPSKEICDKMSISESNLWVLLHRARLQLKECLGQYVKT